MEVRAVAAGPPPKPWRLITPLEALTLGGAGDVDLLDLGESLDGLQVADLVIGGVVDADLAQVAGRLGALLGEVTRHGLVDLVLAALVLLHRAETELDSPRSRRWQRF